MAARPAVGKPPAVKFFSVLPRAAPWLTGAWWALIVLRGSLPALFSVVVAGVVAAVATQDPYIKVSEVCVLRLVIFLEKWPRGS